MSVQSVVRWLLPKEDHFYDFLEGQSKAALEAANLMATLRKGDRLEDVRDQLNEIEHKGDKLFHELEDALAQTFVTPIDREDLQKISSELDDVLDLTNAAIRAAVLLGVKELSEPMHELVGVLVEITEQIDRAVFLLRKHAYAEIREPIVAARQMEKRADTIYREAIRSLFEDPKIDAKQLLREREVLDDLENAIDHADRVASTLANLAVKHG